ncbi:MAG: glycosyltransferase [Lachnospiraceae bacterium]|nr:glycosyltransferase [Lachnospiraceae bacterium]
MEKKISIIVPIYKVEEYLEKCIESLISQTYRNLEIILVDDGSPDKCGEICDHYAAIDSRIKVIHKKNEGVAMARNDGLDIAQGDYISFVDSDDWLAEDTYECFVESMRKYKVDCVMGCCQVVIDREGELDFRPLREWKLKIWTQKGAMKSVLVDGSAIWNRLFKKEVFENLRFPVGRINDDEYTVLRAYALCNRILFLNKPTYNYRIRKNSITTSAFSMRKVDVFYNAKDNMEYIIKVRPELKDYAEAKFVKAGLYCYYNLLKMKTEEQEVKQQKKDALRNIKKELRKIRSSIMHNKRIAKRYKAAVAALTMMTRREKS